MAVRFPLSLFCVVVFTVGLMVSYGSADNAYGSLYFEECNFTYFWFGFGLVVLFFNFDPESTINRLGFKWLPKNVSC